jgi:hypothetical protein
MPFLLIVKLFKARDAVLFILASLLLKEYLGNSRGSTNVSEENIKEETNYICVLRRTEIKL